LNASLQINVLETSGNSSEMKRVLIIRKAKRMNYATRSTEKALFLRLQKSKKRPEMHNPHYAMLPNVPPL
jgi:hypothetical protein